MVHVETRRYALVLRGHEVVVIDPPDRHCPLYQRDHHREHTMRWRRAARFCPRRTIPWTGA